MGMLCINHDTASKCSGRDAISGDRITIEFDDVIQHLDPAFSEESRTMIYVAPGFIDIQINGFAGVDYNSPDAPHEEIARSLQVMFSTGVTRCFPTVITGDPEKMLGALRNLAAARESIPEGGHGDGGVSRRGPAHFARRRSARRASAALGPAAGH